VPEFAACAFHDPFRVGHELSVDRVVDVAIDEAAIVATSLAGRSLRPLGPLRDRL
jgi:hypothetical protein